MIISGFSVNSCDQRVISATVVSNTVSTAPIRTRRRLQPAGQSGTRVVRRELTQHDCFLKRLTNDLFIFFF